MFGCWRASFSWASRVSSTTQNNLGFSILNTKQLQTVVDTSLLAPVSCSTLLLSNHTTLLFANMNASQMFVSLLSLCTFSIDALSTGAKQRTQTTTAASTLLNPQPRSISRKNQGAWERNIHHVCSASGQRPKSSIPISIRRNQGLSRRIASKPIYSTRNLWDGAHGLRARQGNQ